MKYTDKSIEKRKSSRFSMEDNFVKIESEYGEIPVKIEYRSVVRMRLQATPDGFEAIIPHGISQKAALEFVRAYSDWIKKMYVEKIKGREERPNEVHILGTVRHINYTEGEPKFKIEGDEIYFSAPRDSAIQRVFIRELGEYAWEYLSKYTYSVIDKYNEILKLEKKPRVQMTFVKGYWGNCFFEENLIRYNVKLMQLDIECIDYVVKHELAHFIEHSHNADFHSTLAKLCPNEKEIRKKINKLSLLPFPPKIV